MTTATPYGIQSLDAKSDDGNLRSIVQPTEHDLWRSWRDLGDEASRDALAHMYLPYTRALAAMAFARRVHDDVDFDDYLQCARLGLMESLDRFDPELGVLFKTFATRRINGAIVDGVRMLSERQQQMLLSKRVAEVRMESLGAEQVEFGDAKDLLKELAGIGIGLALGFILDETGMVESQEAVAPDRTYERMELRQLRQHLAAVLAQLTDREHDVIKMHYFNGATFNDIASDLRLSKGRVSQLHKSGLVRLRELLKRSSRCDVDI
jgi:RNA polymerase sigma factor for flagellar operon FliA